MPSAAALVSSWKKSRSLCPKEVFFVKLCKSGGLRLPSPRSLVIPWPTPLAHSFTDDGHVPAENLLPKSAEVKKTHPRLQPSWMEASIWSCQTSDKSSEVWGMVWTWRGYERNIVELDKGATGLQKAGFAIGIRSNRIENSIRFGAWSTETFGRFGRVFRFNFRSRARSSSETVESNRNSVC